jgi:hypothetical protein
MFSRELRFDDHTRIFSVDSQIPQGWEVQVVHDGHVVRRRIYSDWHRVERAIRVMEREVSQLESQGWEPAVAPEGAQSTNR